MSKKVAMKKIIRTTIGAVTIGLSIVAFAQSVVLQTASELRSDKLPNAAVLRPLAAGETVSVISKEGGWAHVELGGRQNAITGWIPIGSLPKVTLSSIEQSTRRNVRSLPERENRHALIIGVGRYADTSIPALPGTVIDRESATQMARAMQVPTNNIRYLHDEQATGDGIRKALTELNSRVDEGDRVFIHYSGHGTRYNDPTAGGCVEALLAHDGGTKGTIPNREMADLLKPITNKTDKLFVMYDACHSGGLVQMASTVRTRGFTNLNDAGALRPKFAAITEECGRPVNVRGRNLLVEQTQKGALPQDIIHVSASRDNEVSFDDEQKGGLATQFMRDCMLRDAVDLDGSGAVTIDEIRMCAQDKLNKRMQNDALYKPHNIQLIGNSGFVPAWFSQPRPVALAAAADVITPPPVSQPSAPVPPSSAVVSGPATLPGTAPHVAAAAPLTGEQALRQMFEQRDAKRSVKVTLGSDILKIGQDYLDMSVLSDKAGYAYVAMAGSDNRSLYVLFPNDLDKENRIEAGKKLTLPRANWRVKAGGPAGTNTLLVMVADSPRSLTALASNPAISKSGPFVTSLNDADGRAQLGAMISNTAAESRAECSRKEGKKRPQQCSDAYGASMVSVLEQN